MLDICATCLFNLSRFDDDNAWHTAFCSSEWKPATLARALSHPEAFWASGARCKPLNKLISPQLLHCSCLNENRPEDYQTSSKCTRRWHRWCWRWSKTSPLIVASNCVFKLSGLCKLVHYNLFYFEPVYQSNPLYAYWSTDRDCLLGKPLRIPIFIALHNKTDINTSRNFWCARAWHW